MEMEAINVLVEKTIAWFWLNGNNKRATRKDYRIRFKAMEIVIYKE